MAINLRAEYSVFTDRINVFVYQKTEKKIAVGKPLVFEQVEVGAICDPSFSLKKSEAQELVDELWRAGLRPSEGTGSAGAMAATERHLKDMQKIAIGLLKKDGVDV